MGKALDLSDQRFGRLVAKKPTNERRGGKVVWECKCDCGNLTKIITSSLLNGKTRSCGCLKRKASKVSSKKINNLIHGHSIRGKWSRVYVTWAAMIQRCNNPKNNSYKDYGGRGIKVCNQWLKFEGFLESIGERPRGTSIERKDNDGNYEPGNCRWASAIEQGRNRRHIRLNPPESAGNQKTAQRKQINAKGNC